MFGATNTQNHRDTSLPMPSNSSIIRTVPSVLEFHQFSPTIVGVADYHRR